MQESVLKRLLSSAKFWTMIIGGIATAGATLLAKYGLEVSDAAISQIAITVSGLFAVLVHAQGQADQGKNAVPKLEAPAPAEPPKEPA